MNEFTGIWIPAEILALDDLNLTEKVLASQVLMLSRTGECTAKNAHLSAQVGLTETSISLTLKSLKAKGYICIEDGKDKGNKRQMYPSLKILNTLCKNLKEGWDGVSPPSLKILKSLFKIFKEATQESYTPYLKILNTLFKNLKEPYIRNENKEESKIESKEEIECVPVSADAPTLSPTDEAVDLEEKKESPQPPVPAAPLPPVEIEPATQPEPATEPPAKAPRSRSKPSAEPTIVTRIRDLIKSRNESYYWEGKDAGAAAQLATKLRSAITQKSGTCTDDDIINALTVMLDRTAELKEYYHFASMARLNSQFNEIITQLKRPAATVGINNPGAYSRLQRPTDAEFASAIDELAEFKYRRFNS
ncbi:putative transcriptional regulator [Spirosoma lacussanchae]|uniref:hypothetical protein n=1 Tax=Spirosoma lacussanchae TaxID=1884249 RepID=UPI001109304B|nr:hypothetical protein [Spirosoma lacussanchae]